MTGRPQERLALIREVLGDEYLDLEVVQLTLEEELESEFSKVRMQVKDQQNGGKLHAVEGQGCGMVDALFDALSSRYAKEYQSLESIEFASFEIRAKFDTKKRRMGADAVGELTMEVRNSEGKSFHFSDASRSIATSAARAVVAAVEYFVNAERAFVTLYRSLNDAKERKREDLVSRYTAQLAEVVKSTSYAEVIDRIKKEIS